jgi:hypothetical protein
VIRVYPNSTPQAQSTTDLVNRLRRDVLPGFEHRTGLPVLVGGFTAASIDFSHVLASKLPLFFAIVILLSVLLLFVIFRSLVIPIQAAIVNLLTIGAALGVTVAVFQQGWLASVLGVEKGPIEAWVPVIMFGSCSDSRWITRCSSTRWSCAACCCPPCSSYWPRGPGGCRDGSRHPPTPHQHRGLDRAHAAEARRSRPRRHRRARTHADESERRAWAAAGWSPGVSDDRLDVVFGAGQVGRVRAARLAGLGQSCRR